MQTRSAVKRLQSGHQASDEKEALPHSESSDEESSEHDDTPPPLKKRRRQGVGTTPKRPRRGKPGSVCELNIDVLYLIFSLSRPMEVLNFARTCKSIRAILMSKSSAFIWRAARSQVEDLPDCPPDLSEPAYANLVFYPRCHVCGKYTASILWRMRRRYCKECRAQRLCSIQAFPTNLYGIIFWSGEELAINRVKCQWFDREQIESWIDEYQNSTEKDKFLADKRKHYEDIDEHARDCVEWRKMTTLIRKDELQVLRRERHENIIQRLKALGYEPEITYFGSYHFQEPRNKALKSLTDREWDRALPGWLETMNEYRQRRLNKAVYEPRRYRLASDYKQYLSCGPSDLPKFDSDFLPHVADVAQFPPFQEIINAPEGTELGDHPFAHAFAQLPVLVGKWKKQLDIELAELVKIPLILGDASPDINVAGEDAKTPASDKLKLACAMFFTGGTCVATASEIFSFCMRTHVYPSGHTDVSVRSGSIKDRFDISFLDEAPYIVRACELDPNVATVDDMNNRNARLRCLHCKSCRVVTWREAMVHARWRHVMPPLGLYWELVNDKYIDLIQAVEFANPVTEVSYFTQARCLLCLCSVGDAMRGRDDMPHHLSHRHEVKPEDIKPGVHFEYLGINGIGCANVEMVEDGDQVLFVKA